MEPYRLIAVVVRKFKLLNAVFPVTKCGGRAFYQLNLDAPP